MLAPSMEAVSTSSPVDANRCPGSLSLSEAEGAQPTLKLHGVWRMVHLPELAALLDGFAIEPTRPPEQVDASELQDIDSASALLLLRWLRAAGIGGKPWHGLSPAQARIVEGVRSHLARAQPVAPPGPSSALAQLGRGSSALATVLLGHLNFLGASLLAGLDVLRGRQKLRLRELTVQIEQTGLMAIPVVALVTLLIGVVIAYLLGLQAEQYGASIFVVDGVAIGATREFAPIIVAVIVAGRSGAAFTAQLGSMRLTEEIDAIKTLGLDPMQVLVLPRVLALMLTLPLLVFVGDVMSILGGMLIAEPMLGITPAGYLARLRESLDLRHVWVGLAKAPVFALFIAVIGVRMGMTVGRDTRAVGAATTSTVVQSIVAVILLDAGFAVLLQALHW